MSLLRVIEAGPGLSLQDQGRPGLLAQGVSRGGAADRLALAEGAALLRQPVGVALEMAGFGGVFEAEADLRIALSGAPMRVTLDGAPLAWNASHLLRAGAKLSIGGALRGVYGYLTLEGESAIPEVLGARSAHLTAGIGGAVTAGDALRVVPKGGACGLCLPVSDRFAGGVLRVLPSLQTSLFAPAMRARLEAERFRRDVRGNRMGMRLVPDGEGFGLDRGQSILSEVISPGDIQIPGDGAPYVLLAECQTTGGYPRIGTVIPADLPRAAQAGPGAELGFRFVSREDALQAEHSARAHLAALPERVEPLLRDPREMADLLSYSLISGVTAGGEI